ncbi:helix-turn-helix transcriptional regulator [Thermopolyspora sp. NPDC052614]|uniref:helix-turn-helix domain-containing protein n=1 Tax=Thermopolyspora sp. NPDC052614 TaxID=3155682 RepID=UPI00341EB595
MADRLSSKNHSPTVRRRRLAAALREARAKSGLSREEVADQMEWSTSKVYRLEYGRTAASWRDVRDLCELYGVPSPEKDGLVQLARDSRQRGWWSEYQDIFPSNFVGLESDASIIRSYESELIPGLLQTEDYARALNRTFRPSAPEDEIERRVSARMARQGVFDRSTPPELTCILSEAVIRRCLAIDGDVGAAQLRALIAAAERPNITIRIVPLATGLHPGMDGAFVIIGFPDEADPDVAYVEGLMGSVFVESVDGVKRYKLIWDQLSGHALSAAESRDLIRAELKRP